MTKLNLACGSNYLKGYTNTDIDTSIKTDKRCDLGKIPYPFKDNEFNEIYCSNFIEHLTITIPEFLLECKRILNREGKLILIFPNSWWWHCRLSFMFGSFLWKSHYSPYHFNQLVKPSWVKLVGKLIGFDVQEGKKCGGVSGFLFSNNLDLRESTAVLTLRKRG